MRAFNLSECHLLLLMHMCLAVDCSHLLYYYYNGYMLISLIVEKQKCFIFSCVFLIYDFRFWLKGHTFFLLDVTSIS